MSGARRLVVVCGALWALPVCGQTPAPGCSATAKPGKTEVTAGESFSVEVTADGPAGASFVFPDEASDEKVELRAAPPTAGLSQGNSRRYDAVALAVGEAQIPPLAVKCRLADGRELEARTPAVTLRMLSVLPKDPQEQKLADVRPPVALGIGAAFWIGLAILLAACAGLGVALWRRRRRGVAPVSVSATVPPEAEARAALAQLAAQGLLAGRQFREFYIALIEIAKRYLERRLAAPVLEMTSTEAHAFVRRHAHGESLAPALRELLAAGDQIKFAKGEGMGVEAERHLRAVGAMIDALEEKQREPARQAVAP